MGVGEGHTSTLVHVCVWWWWWWGVPPQIQNKIICYYKICIFWGIGIFIPIPLSVFLCVHVSMKQTMPALTPEPLFTLMIKYQRLMVRPCILVKSDRKCRSVGERICHQLRFISKSFQNMRSIFQIKLLKIHTRCIYMDRQSTGIIYCFLSHWYKQYV